jgi:hypothetical protein
METMLYRDLDMPQFRETIQADIDNDNTTNKRYPLALGNIR